MMKIVSLMVLGMFPVIAMAGTAANVSATPPRHSAFTGGYTIVQNGKVVASGKGAPDYASKPEHFAVTITRLGRVVEAVHGVTLPGSPIMVNDLTDIGYIAKANPRSLKNGTVSSGYSFFLVGHKGNLVQVDGSISKLVGIVTHKTPDGTVQLPAVHTETIHEVVHLAAGHSTIIPMGSYRVKIARMIHGGKLPA